MFSKLRSVLKKGVDTFSEKVAKKIAYKELSEEDFEGIEDNLILELAQSDVAYDVAVEIVENVKKRLLGIKVKRGTDIRAFVEESFREAILDILSKPTQVDILEEIETRCKRKLLTKIMFLGVNGVGKTTTIAKMAYLLKKKGITPVIGATDTFRAGAQEQLKLHMEKLGLPFIGGRYGADPASVGYDAMKYAEARGYCVVLIDTAGRLHVDRDLMEELKKVSRVTKPDYKILVIDSLTGNDALDQVKFFDDAVSIDGIILTKMDADVKGGTAVSVIAMSGKPVIFIGTGQKYEDLEPFDPEDLVGKIFS
ncbi:MAG: signal recognition particle-docking protein FtsY [Desulfurococcales archaeon]|nr:signal recognition particle-docking protein FtsY [Desulfurococcales archaeon]